jgi:dehydratase
MHPFRTTTSRITRALAAALTAGAGLTACAALLLAGTAPAAAAASGATLSSPVSYACSLSSYGPGLAPLTVNATMSAPSSVTAGTSLTVTLVTSGTTIPPMTTAALPAMSYIHLTGVATLHGAAALSDSLTGNGTYLGAPAGSMTQLPSITSAGTVTPTSAGTMTVSVPSSISLVPSGTSAAMAPMSCTAASVTSVQVTVTVSPAATASMTSPAAMPAATASMPAPTASGMAPNTGAGGSLHSPIDMTLLGLGAVVAVAGIGTMLLAIRRRGRTLTS